MFGFLRRWNERRKLRKGQCGWCSKPLRDDATDSWCSAECADAYLDRNAI